jgi:cysteinyl-tRNA synthetase
MAFTLYNSLSRTREPFQPITEGHVGMYVCGPTVYGPPHLGHAKSYITFDVLAKFLRASGYKVRYVQNITDVGHLTDDADAGEDKIQKKARLDQVHPYEIVDTYLFQYFHEMEALKITHPSFYVRATQHIGEQIETIQQLIAKGHAYEVNGNVYFDVRSWKDYGKLSGRSIEDQKEGSRVETRSDKRNPQDFALWKRAEPSHILQWNSPWGSGYPGWHIECSVMSQKYLGETFDIHGGGLDNMFPHHECEIAQAEATTGKLFVRYWVHHNMVTVDGIKMGKSLGNFKTVRALLDTHSPEALRAFLLSTHYRSPTNYTEEAIHAATTGLTRLSQLKLSLLQAIKENKPAGSLDAEVEKLSSEADRQIREELENDLNTPGAIAHLYTFASALNKLSADAPFSGTAAQRAMRTLDSWGEDILGIVGKPRETSGSVDLAPIMDIVIELRKEMKSSKRFDLADKIRDRLKEAGIQLEDTKDGVRWRKA